MRTGLEKLANAVHHYEHKIADATLKQTENLGNGLISKLSNELDVQYSKFKARMKEQIDEDVIRVPTRVFYIIVICFVSLFCFSSARWLQIFIYSTLVCYGRFSGGV